MWHDSLYAIYEANIYLVKEWEQTSLGVSAWRYRDTTHRDCHSSSAACGIPLISGLASMKQKFIKDISIKPLMWRLRKREEHHGEIKTYSLINKYMLFRDSKKKYYMIVNI